MKHLQLLHQRHKGEDIYVIGSGASLNYLQPSFFENKIVVGVNLAYRFFPCTYVVAHHHNIAAQILADHQNLVISEYDCCVKNGKTIDLPGFYYLYKHKDQAYSKTDFSALDDPEMLITGGTTAINGVGLAWHLGAKNIILAGFDGVTVNGKNNIEGYYGPATNVNRQIHHSRKTYPWLLNACNHIRSRGVNVISLNPFINYKNDGHRIN